MGGEELAVVLVDADLHGARIVAERIRSTVATLAVECPDDAPLTGIHVSIGVASLEPEDDTSSLLRRADARLYEAKRNGRDRVVG
jgi:diguanylate cyclase (GGDEF)-like protein